MRLPRRSGAGAPTLLAMTDKGMPHHISRVSTEIREVPRLQRRNEEFESLWVDTGRSSVMMKYLKREELAELDYDNVVAVSEQELKSCPLEFLPPITVLYQAGYLTIKSYSDRRYTLCVPNAEVRVHEAAYARTLKTVLEAAGFTVQLEVSQAQGRADVVALHPRGNFVFELKVDKPVELALDQIREKNYTLPYQVGEVSLYAIGLAFDSKTRNIKDMQVVRVR